MRPWTLTAVWIACALAQNNDDSSVSNTDSNSASQTDDSSSQTDDSKSSQTDDSQSASQTDSSDASSSDDSNTNTDTSSTDSNTDSKTDDSSSDDDSKTDSSDDSKTDDSKPTETTSVSINPVMPPGSISWVTPTTTDSLYVKIGDYQTFSWNYTNLQVTPTAINIDLYCDQNSHTYTLAQNRSIDDTEFVWNTTDTNDNDPDGMHLLTASYTLRIYNSSGKPDDMGSAGLLQPVEYVFGVYMPLKYDSWANAGKYINAANMPQMGGVAATLFITCIAALM